MKKNDNKAQESSQDNMKNSNINLKDFNTLEDFQKFIDENNILNATDFKKLNSSVYTKMRNLGFVYRVKYKSPRQKNYEVDLDLFQTVEDFQKFIDENSIQNVKDFRERFPSQCGKASKLKLTPKLIFLNPLISNKKYQLSDFQKIVEENNIVRAMEFKKKFPKEYKRMSTLKLNSKIKYKNPRSSYLEKEVSGLLSNLQLEFDFDKHQDFLSKGLRADFIISNYKIIIECQGSQHFLETKYFKRTLEDQQGKDKTKYEDCIRAGYSVLYVVLSFTDPRYKQVDFENLKYFDKIYFSLDELKIRILEIIDEYNKTHSEENSNNPQDGEGTGV